MQLVFLWCIVKSGLSCLGMLVPAFDPVELMVLYQARAGLLEMKGDSGVNTLSVQAQYPVVMAYPCIEAGFTADGYLAYPGRIEPGSEVDRAEQGEHTILL